MLYAEESIDRKGIKCKGRNKRTRKELEMTLYLMIG
jgi:hypothetical protein